jgi:hypothetical protein
VKLGTEATLSQPALEAALQALRVLELPDNAVADEVARALGIAFDVACRFDGVVLIRELQPQHQAAA